MCKDSNFCLSRCHFLYIYASKESHKNKGEVSQMTRVPQVENHWPTLRKQSTYRGCNQ